MNKKGDDKFIYICTKLFNYNDKLQAEYLESSLRNKLNCNVFMPFRDTDENKLIGANRTKIIYDADIERLNSGNIILLAVLMMEFVKMRVYHLKLVMHTEMGFLFLLSILISFGMR